jgi:hypothetical protein
MFGKLAEFAKKLDVDDLMQKAAPMLDKLGVNSSEGQRENSSTATEINHGPGGACRALLIGINYTGQQGELRGCHADVNNMNSFIVTKGFSDIKILKDVPGEEPPTRANVLAAMRWLVADAKENSSLFLHFSGHGSHQKDKDGDEKDGNDETICPVDYATAGMIVDDELHDILVKPLPKGCKLVAVFDCCHSGSGMDLYILI